MIWVSVGWFYRQATLIQKLSENTCREEQYNDSWLIKMNNNALMYFGLLMQVIMLSHRQYSLFHREALVCRGVSPATCLHRRRLAQVQLPFITL